MLKKKIKYVDFNGIEREEDFYFHLSSPEIVRMEAKYGGSAVEYTQRVVEEGDLSKMISFIEDLILTSVGKKSQDGRSFVKPAQFVEEFEYSEAYAKLFEEILTDPKAAEAFASGVGQITSNPDSPRQQQLNELKKLREDQVAKQ